MTPQPPKILRLIMRYRYGRLVACVVAGAFGGVAQWLQWERE